MWSVADSLWNPEYPYTTEGFRGRLARISRALETVRATADPKLLIVPASAGLQVRGVRTVTSYSEDVKPPAAKKLKTEAGEGGGAC